ncbi:MULTISPECIES: SRPBCC domain-containing protein [Nonomuraea]|uniref:SRPBCC domain-containing protein n=1 Tax=Nonomuraea ferruginea TaxID=46174 RepID=A0ABT4SRF0_9ACTN|nr:SRPBCC domain-containing protein [Nonomuraea ferruginea]MDA0639625.1 SRPBCC domain-containing protein [Nonomuraea ferruginea]
MKLEQSVVIDADAARVWALLCEPESAAGCVPGVRLDGRDDDGHHRGELTVSFGPTRVAFSGVAEIVMAPEDMSGTIVARGADRQGRSRASGTLRFRLVPGDGSVRLVSSADVAISGPLAGFAESGGRHVVEQLLAGMAANVSARLRDERPAPGTVRLSLREVLAAWLARFSRWPWRRGGGDSPTPEGR